LGVLTLSTSRHKKNGTKKNRLKAAPTKRVRNEDGIVAHGQELPQRAHCGACDPHGSFRHRKQDLGGGTAGGRRLPRATATGGDGVKAKHSRMVGEEGGPGGSASTDSATLKRGLMDNKIPRVVTCDPAKVKSEGDEGRGYESTKKGPLTPEGPKSIWNLETW